MKKIYRTVPKQIEQLCDQLEDSFLISLLLIRKLAQDDFCLSLSPSEDDCEKTGRHLWEIVADNQADDYISSFTEALTLVQSQFPFVQELIEQNKKQTVKEDVLRSLIDLLSDASVNALPSALIYEHLLRRKSPMRRASGNFHTPAGIAQCLAVLLNPKHGTAYDPCCGSGTLLLAAQMHSGQNLQLCGQAQDEDSYLQCQVNFLLNDTYAALGDAPANTLLNDLYANHTFDYILSNPPFNHTISPNEHMPLETYSLHSNTLLYSNANFAWLQYILNHLKPNGRAAVIMPNGTLTTQRHSQSHIRKAIIQKNLIEAIITLPPGLFYTTKIPCCIWLLTNTDRKSDEILFIDAAKMKPMIKKDITDTHLEQLKELVYQYRQGNLQGSTEWYGVASLKLIEEKEFLLSPNLYTAVLRPKPMELQRKLEKLPEVIEKISLLPIDPKVLTSVSSWKNAKPALSWSKANLLDLYDVSGGITKNKASFGRGHALLDVKSVIHSPYVPNSLSLCVDVTESEQAKYNIKYGDVFLNRTSETTKELACCCVAIKDQEAVYSGFIKRLRPRDVQLINPLYAACYFRSDIYRWEIENVSTVYTTYASIDNRKLAKVTVYYPDAATQQKIGNTLLTVFRYRQQCPNEPQNALLKEFAQLLIRQYITYPIVCIQNKEGDFQCR